MMHSLQAMSLKNWGWAGWHKGPKSLATSAGVVVMPLKSSQIGLSQDCSMSRKSKGSQITGCLNKQWTEYQPLEEMKKRKLLYFIHKLYKEKNCVSEEMDGDIVIRE